MYKILKHHLKHHSCNLYDDCRRCWNILQHPNIDTTRGCERALVGLPGTTEKQNASAGSKMIETAVDFNLEETWTSTADSQGQKDSHVDIDISSSALGLGGSPSTPRAILPMPSFES